MREIKSNKKIMIIPADKGLGPVCVDTEQYITWGLQHLLDSTTYRIIPEETAIADATLLRKGILDWTRQHHDTLDNDDITYIRHHTMRASKDPFGYFYLLAKLHKTPISTRPVCSDCASIPHSLGKWVNQQLQPIVQNQSSYSKNSFELKKMMDQLTLPPNACLFTFDAVSMYTNINTLDCIEQLSAYLH